MHYVLNNDGYVKGFSDSGFAVNGIGSLPLPTPENFDTDYCHCYQWVNGEWIFDATKKGVASNDATPTLEQRVEATEAAILAIMEMGLMPSV